VEEPEGDAVDSTAESTDNQKIRSAARLSMLALSGDEILGIMHSMFQGFWKLDQLQPVYRQRPSAQLFCAGFMAGIRWRGQSTGAPLPHG
jgi:hypothetical protein